MGSGGGRSGPRHHAAILYAGRGRCDAAVHARRAKEARVRRRSIDTPSDPRVAQGIGREMRAAAIDPLAIYEGIVRGGGDRVRVAGIPVVEVPEIIHVVKIVEVVELGVVHVHVIPVTRTTLVPRTERLSPTEREPAKTTAPTEAESKVEAEESNKRRAIIRRRVDRAWAPAPIGTKVVPAAVVIGRKTQWFS